MKKLLMLILVVTSLSISVAQDINAPVYNQEFENCEQDYNELRNMVIQKRGFGNKYFKDSEPFSGCAKYASIGAKGELAEYMVAHIQDGYATKLTYYFPDGSISREFNFKDGRAHGRHIMYYRNGDTYIEEYYDEGRPHGSQKRWLENGDAGRIGLYDFGMPIFDLVYVADTKC
ncbi:toxin-antitoxin system YwqK family antitoxin [Portibacter lacus]|uniref:Toxin-antitoxin system YwqK family antitoxin n=1 Tax=Portibacter lacus TaxID=1099794 RepID=A0AA37SN57_9BACT|nr:hypothetical protein [Portibacter lacus]GLR17701.1 hypothetical protein GCM10007940_23160 [Portibacter lacus]